MLCHLSYQNTIVLRFYVRTTYKEKRASGTVEIFTEWLCTWAITFTVTDAIISPLYNILLDYLRCAQKHTRDSPNPL